MADAHDIEKSPRPLTDADRVHARIAAWSYLTEADVALRWSVPPQAVAAACESGELAHHVFGGARRIAVSDLFEYERKSRRGPTAEAVNPGRRPRRATLH